MTRSTVCFRHSRIRSKENKRTKVQFFFRINPTVFSNKDFYKKSIAVAHRCIMLLEEKTFPFLEGNANSGKFIKGGQQKRHFEMSYLRAGFVGSFVGQKNAISKCRTFGPDLLGRPARHIENVILFRFFCCPAPFFIIYFGPPHFCPPQMTRRRRTFGKT